MTNDEVEAVARQRYPEAFVACGHNDGLFVTPEYSALMQREAIEKTIAALDAVRKEK